MTQKDQLDAAQAKVTELEGKLSAAQGQVSTLTTQANEAKQKLIAAEGERDQARTQLQTEQNAHAQTKQTLQATEQERDGLKAKDKSAGTKAAEQLAANGIPPVQKDTPAKVAEGQKDGATLYAEYSGLMQAGKGREASRFWAKHEDALMAHAEASTSK